MRRGLIVFLFFAGLALLWELAVRSGRWSAVLLPSPVSVAEYLWASLRDGTLLESAWITLKRLLVGYFLGLAIGLPLGLLTSTSQVLEDTIGAMALGMQTLPSVCWVPLALIWFGQTEGAMLFVVVMGTVWSVIIATDYGARSIPPIFARAARTMGSAGLHRWTRVILPASLPFLVTGMKQGWAFAWRSLMAAELITYSPRLGQGLGQLLNIGRELSQMSLVITSIILILVVGVAIELLVFAPLERRVLIRRGLTVR
jgi:NitT/TauT family transport system permease protein